MEGDKGDVLGLMERIEEDARHSQVVVLSSGRIDSREFHNWEMAYEDFQGANNQLQYLKLLLSSFLETTEVTLEPIPTSQSFWSSARKLLKPESVRKHE